MSGINRDEIIRMAQEVSGVEFPASMDGVKIGMRIEHLERFAALVAAAERKEWADEFAGMGEWSCVHMLEKRGQG